MPRLLNKYRDGVPPGAVYIGRPSKWGNPFPITAGANREIVVKRYREHILSKPELIAAARRELAGKDLVCFCAPQACHGDVLLELANSQETGDGPETTD